VEQLYITVQEVEVEVLQVLVMVVLVIAGQVRILETEQREQQILEEEEEGQHLNNQLEVILVD
jgi:hypothetical protein